MKEDISGFRYFQLIVLTVFPVLSNKQDIVCVYLTCLSLVVTEFGLWTAFCENIVIFRVQQQCKRPVTCRVVAL